MNVLIVEEGLETLHGHYFQYLQDLADGGRQAGHRIDILAHKDACGEILTSIGAKPWLSRSVHRTPLSRNPLRRLYAIVAHNCSLQREVIGWSRQSDCKYDVTIFPSVRIEHLWGIYSLQKNDGEGKLGELVAILIDAPGVRTSDGKYVFPRGSAPLRFSLWWASWRAFRKRLTFAAESARMANHFRAFCGLSFLTVPHVTIVPPELIWRGSAEGGSQGIIRFGTFGFTRYDKGLDVFQDAIKLLPLESENSIEFVIQWTGDYSLPSGKRIVPDSELLGRWFVKFIPAFRESSEYYQWLGSIDAVVLPYRRDFYSDRMSRVAVDAALVGLPVVYPKDTWLEEFHQSYGAGVGFLAEDPVSLAGAILQLCQHYSGLSRVSIDNIERTREAFSAGQFFQVIGDAIAPE